MNLTEKGKIFIRDEIPNKIYFNNKFEITNNVKDKEYILYRSKIEEIMYEGTIKHFRKEDKKMIKIILKKYKNLNQFLKEIKKLKKCFNKNNEKAFEKIMKKWSKSDISILKTYTRGIYDDFDAVKNAVKINLTNGIAEGKINKIKTIKRVCYGRANFDLLTARLFLSDYFHSIE